MNFFNQLHEFLSEYSWQRYKRKRREVLDKELAELLFKEKYITDNLDGHLEELRYRILFIGKKDRDMYHRRFLEIHISGINADLMHTRYRIEYVNLQLKEECK